MRLPHFSTLDRYLLAQLVPPFFISLAAVLAALLLERLLVLFDDLAAEGSSLATFVSLLTDLLPHYLGLALPAALCVSVFLIIRRMSDNNEIDALMASGVSLLRIARPYMWTGMLIGGGSILLYGYIQPVARYDFRSGFYYAAHSGWAPHLQTGMFAATSGDTMLTADHVTRNGTALSKVFIQQREPSGAVRIITAHHGLITTVPSLKQTRLDLWDGLIVYDPRDGSNKTMQTRYNHSVRIFDQSRDTVAFRMRGIDERELTLVELATRLEASHQSDTQVDDGGITRSSLRAELDFRLARALGIPFIPPLAVTLAIGAKRRRPIVGLIALAIVLVGFDHTLQFGHGLIASGQMRGFYAIWVPELIFCTICLASIIRRSQGSWRPRKAVRLNRVGPSS